MNKYVKSVGIDILNSERFAKAWQVPHHSKDGTIAAHSIKTAEYAYMIARWLARRGVAVNERDVIRASLLHDIGMTEDEVFLSPSRVKAYTHPKEGCRIARDEFGANEVQIDAIRRHMWPIGHIAPHTTEGWVVAMADKCCSVYEVQKLVFSKTGQLMRLGISRR